MREPTLGAVNEESGVTESSEKERKTSNKGTRLRVNESRNTTSASEVTSKTEDSVTGVSYKKRVVELIV